MAKGDLYDVFVTVLACAMAAYVVLGLLRKQQVTSVVLNADRARLLNAGRLPSYFKYKESLLMPVRNQRNCASCWAFACSDTFADTLNLKSGGKWPYGHLSPQYLLSCTRLHYGCKRGGSPEDVYSSREAALVGVPLEQDMPYEAAVTGCQALPTEAVRVRTVAGTGIDICADPSYALPGFKQKVIAENVLNMKKSLLQYGPILGTLRITKELYAYDASSIFVDNPDSATLGGHAVEIIGWSDRGANAMEPGFDDAYWICRNSYDSSWGGELHGYAYIKMGVNCADIESRASICKVEVPEFLKQAVQQHDIWTSAYTSYGEYASDPDKQNFMDPDRQRFLDDLHKERLAKGKQDPVLVDFMNQPAEQ